MTADKNPDGDTNQAHDEPAGLSARETIEAIGEQLKPRSPIENLKSNTPMPGDSLLTKVMKVITSWT